MPKIAGAEFLVEAYSFLEKAGYRLSRAQLRAAIQRERGRNSPEYKELVLAHKHTYEAISALNRLADELKKVGRRAPYTTPPKMSRSEADWYRQAAKKRREAEGR